MPNGCFKEVICMKVDMKKVNELTGADRKTITKVGRRLSRKKIKKIHKLLHSHPCLWQYFVRHKSLSNISEDDWNSFTPEARQALEDFNEAFGEENTTQEVEWK